MDKKQRTLSAERRNKTILSVVLAVISVIYVMPVFMVLLNSFKLICQNRHLCPPHRGDVGRV